MPDLAIVISGASGLYVEVSSEHRCGVLDNQVNHLEILIFIWYPYHVSLHVVADIHGDAVESAFRCFAERTEISFVTMFTGIKYYGIDILSWTLSIQKWKFS